MARLAAAKELKRGCTQTLNRIPRVGQTPYAEHNCYTPKAEVPYEIWNRFGAQPLSLNSAKRVPFDTAALRIAYQGRSDYRLPELRVALIERPAHPE
jgi:hypothetical protein